MQCAQAVLLTCLLPTVKNEGLIQHLESTLGPSTLEDVKLILWVLNEHCIFTE